MIDAQGRAIQQFFITMGKAAARWTRLECTVPEELCSPPALVVVNHGFGGIFDMNAFTIAAIADQLWSEVSEPPVTILTHQLAWTVGIGPLLEPAGFTPATREGALEGLDAGNYVVVMPGGDLDGAKSFPHRNEVVFGGRTGFAKLAIEAGVPIVPVVISGAGETLFVLTDGQRLAKALRLPSIARLKVMPVSLSVPYGLTIGVAGMLPYFPLPAKMRAALLDTIFPEPDETEDELAERVHSAMSERLHEMTADRVPFFGMPWDDLPAPARLAKSLVQRRHVRGATEDATAGETGDATGGTGVTTEGTGPIDTR